MTKHAKQNISSKKLLSLMLALVMVLGMLPLQAFAWEGSQCSGVYYLDGTEKKYVTVESIGNIHVVLWGGYFSKDLPHYACYVPEGTETVYVEYPSSVSISSLQFLANGGTDMPSAVATEGGKAYPVQIKNYLGTENAVATVTAASEVADVFSFLTGSPSGSEPAPFDPAAYYADYPFSSIYFMDGAEKKYLSVDALSAQVEVYGQKGPAYKITVPAGTANVYVEYPTSVVTLMSNGYCAYLVDGVQSYSPPSLVPTDGEAGNKKVALPVDGFTGENKCLAILDEFYVPVGGFTILLGDYVDPASSEVIEKISVESVALDQQELTLNVTESASLTATVLPADATDKSVTWATSDAAVATVSDGAVQALAGGTATLTVTTKDGGKTASCLVTVIDPNAPPMNEAGAYLLDSVEDMVWFSNSVSNGRTSINAELASNIDLTGVEFGPIGGTGSSAQKYMGKFNGAGHTISGLSIQSTDTKGHIGLFSYISGATIENLTVNGSISLDAPSCSDAYLGTFAGRDAGNSTLRNLTSNVTITATNGSGMMRYIAGILGYAGDKTLIENCVNNGNISAKTVSGIVNYTKKNVTIRNCTNNGEISGTGAVGGIVVTTYAGSSIITACINNGNVSTSSTSSYAGGIAGILSSLTISNCTNYGTITGNYYLGGIAGQSSSSTMSNCLNAGSIVNNGSGSSPHTGGLIGYISTKSTVDNCYNTGSVASESTKAKLGGLVGYSSGAFVLTNSYNTANITGKNIAGGLIGEGKLCTITNCYSTGNIVGKPGSVGALIGVDTTENKSSNQCTLTNCYYLSDLNSVGTMSQSGHTHNETNVGKVSADELKAGVELGSAFVFACNSYPALSWQSGITEHSTSDTPVVVPPTCTEDGYTKRTCSNCGAELRDTFVPALGHDYCQHTTAEECTSCDNCEYFAPTCTETGRIVHSCLRENCDSEHIDTLPATGHTLSTEGQTETNLFIDGTCSVCHNSFRHWKDERYRIITLIPESTISSGDSDTYPWVYDAASGTVRSDNRGLANTSSVFTLNFSVPWASELKLVYGISSEYADKLTIMLDSNTLLSAKGGSVSATEIRSDVSAGEHTLTFTYAKDRSADTGSDIAWIESLNIFGEHNHTVYSEPVYTWTSNNKKVTATQTCEGCDKTWSETVSATSVVTTGTCQVEGYTTYTSDPFEREQFAVQTKVVKGSKEPHLTDIDGTVCKVCGETATTSIVTNLQDGFTTKSDMLTFDVLAKDAHGGKLDGSNVRVTMNGVRFPYNWDDSSKTSFTLSFENTTADCTVLVRAGDNSHSYTIHHLEAEEGEVIGTITASLEAFTLGAGYLIEPCTVNVLYGENGAELVTRMLAENGFSYTNTGSLEAGFYLASIIDQSAGKLPVKLNVPKVLKDTIQAYNGTIDPAPSNATSLGEFDYTYMSGWMYSVNNVFPNVGFSDYHPQNGDVMRVQFTLYGYGADLGGGFSAGGGDTTDYYTTANKGELMKYIASVGWDNVSEQTKTVMQKLDARQAEVDACLTGGSVANTELKIQNLPLASDISYENYKDISKDADEALSAQTKYPTEDASLIQKLTDVQDKLAYFAAIDSVKALVAANDEGAIAAFDALDSVQQGYFTASEIDAINAMRPVTAETLVTVSGNVATVESVGDESEIQLNAGSATVLSVPAGNVSKLSGKPITVSTTTASVSFDAAASSTIFSGEGEVSLNLAPVEPANLPEGIVGAIEVSLTGASFTNGKATITIPNVEIESGKIPVVYYINGNKLQQVNGWYNKETKGLSFEATHFSTYGYAQVEPTAFTASLTANETVLAGETVAANIAVTGGEYNAFKFVLSYDKSKLSFTAPAAVDGFSVTDDNGTITILGYGEAQNASQTLSFTAKAVGTADITLTGAWVDEAANAVNNDTPAAAITTPKASVNIGGYPVTLSDDFTGDSFAVPGKDYNFEAKDKNYDYSFESELGVMDKGDGSFTIPADRIAGSLNISAAKTPKTFTVTVTGNGKDDVTAEATATYGTDFTFTVNKAGGYRYTVSSDPTSTAGENNTYTISGANITKSIVITVDKTSVPATHAAITFIGVTAEEVVNGLAQSVPLGQNFSFKLNKDEAYNYVVKQGENELIPDENGTYTIPRVTSNVSITITKTEKNPLSVQVSEYVRLDGKSVYLVTAAKSALAEGQTLAYDGTPMYSSEKYNTFAWLLISQDTLENVKTTAMAAITIANASSTAIDYAGDVNMTNAIDVNDAQLTYDIYNAKYEEFTSVTMEKFLRADVNGDKSLNVEDAAAIIHTVVNG